MVSIVDVSARQKDEFLLGLDRLPLSWLALVTAAALIAVVTAIVEHPSWLQLVFVLAAYGFVRIWRSALARQSEASRLPRFGD